MDAIDKPTNPNPNKETSASSHTPPRSHSLRTTMLPPLPSADDPPSYETIENPISSNTQDEYPSHSIKRSGKLIPLRTLEEIKAAIQTTTCYILPVPAKSINAVLTSLRTYHPNLTSLQHLRRLVKPSFLPASVLSNISLAATTAAQKSPILYLLVCPIADISRPSLESFLLTLPVFTESAENGPWISTVSVPSCQPISTQQANEWSEQYWPTVYKRGNPYGPHPSIVENASKKLSRAEEYMSLARRTGLEAVAAGVGKGFGCVVVDPDTGDVVAVAGDGRCRVNGKGWGNPLNHAVMRAVAMVAQKRLEVGVEVMPENPVRPETQVEKRYFDAGCPVLGSTAAGEEGGDVENGEGYLCHNMHVYLSHEPCVMCAMALLHSRVGVVVFGQRMPRTGALVAEGANGEGEGYGLFWRPELNWKFLCWQWVDDEAIMGEEDLSV